MFHKTASKALWESSNGDLMTGEQWVDLGSDFSEYPPCDEDGEELTLAGKWQSKDGEIMPRNDWEACSADFSVYPPLDDNGKELIPAN